MRRRRLRRIHAATTDPHAVIPRGRTAVRIAAVVAMSLSLSACYYIPDMDEVGRLYDKVVGKEPAKEQPQEAARPMAPAPADPHGQPQPVPHAASSTDAHSPPAPVPSALHDAPAGHGGPAPTADASHAAPMAATDPAHTMAAGPPRSLTPVPRAATPGHAISGKTARASAAAPLMSGKSDDDAYALHLGSYHKMDSLKADWDRLIKKYPEYLTGLRLRVSTFAQGKKDAPFYRLKAGPLPNKDLAAKLCRSLKAQGAYCGILKFGGTPLDQSMAAGN